MARAKGPSRVFAHQTRSWRTNPWIVALQAHRIVLLVGIVLLWAVYLLAGSGKHKYQQDHSLLLAAALAGRITAENLGQPSPDSLRAALQKAIGVQDHRRSQSDHSAESAYLLAQIQSILHDLTEGPSAVDCSLDPTLFTEPFNIDQDNKVLLAANMHNNEDLLPHFIAQLVHVLSLLPYGSAFLSIYESGSTDGTGQWLEVLRRLVTAMHVPHRIVTGGNLTRGPEQDRIDFLAQARNRALEPLWLNASAAQTSDYIQIPPEVHGSARVLMWFSAPAQPLDEPLWPAERVVFLNDVYFCARDVIRLLRHDDVDMACGMDFDRLKLQNLPWHEQRRRFGAHLRRVAYLPEWLGRQIGRWHRLMEGWRLGQGSDDFERSQPLDFYDIWVARDIDGHLLLKQPPYVTDPYSLERVALGLPFPVKCCWNGVVAMTAAPFTRHNLRMRMHKAGECAASECTLLCNDFMRLGYTNFIIDPGVRQAYLARDARDLFNSSAVEALPVTTWHEVASALPIDRKLAPMRPYIQCCGLPEGHNMVEFNKDCAWDNFMAPNYTLPSMPFSLPDSPASNASTANDTLAEFQGHQGRAAALRGRPIP